MSNVSSTHSVTPFIAGSSAALTGQRLAKVGYKSSAKNPARFKSVCASLPTLPDQLITENISRLVPYVRSFLETAQDGILRSLYESSDGTLTEVHDSDLGLDQIIGYLEAENSGGRLTKDYLEAWFDATMKEPLVILFAPKLGFDPEFLNDSQLETLGRHVAQYKALVSSLSGGKTLLNEKQILSVDKAFEFCEVDDDTSRKLVARLEGMKKKDKIEDLLEL